MMAANVCSRAQAKARFGKKILFVILFFCPFPVWLPARLHQSSIEI